MFDTKGCGNEIPIAKQKSGCWRLENSSKDYIDYEKWKPSSKKGIRRYRHGTSTNYEIRKLEQIWARQEHIAALMGYNRDITDLQYMRLMGKGEQEENKTTIVGAHQDALENAPILR